MAIGKPGSTNKTPLPTLALDTPVTLLDGTSGRIALVRRRKMAKRYGVLVGDDVRPTLLRRDQFTTNTGPTPAPSGAR